MISETIKARRKKSGACGMDILRDEMHTVDARIRDAEETLRPLKTAMEMIERRLAMLRQEKSGLVAMAEKNARNA